MKTICLPLVMAILITAISCNNKSQNEAQEKQAKTIVKDAEYPFQLYIVSVSENELVVNAVMGGSGFEIYKRA